MNAIVPTNFGPISGRFSNTPKEDDLSAGVQTGFGIVGYKGKVWSTRYRGSEDVMMREDGDGPRNSIEVVILKASSHVSKIWYQNGYIEGSTAAPDCFSTNGVVPDPGSKTKQSNTCATCPMNAWGSRITPAGKQGKACSDSKRLAVVPLHNIPNEGLGGPMLLRVPAASLRDLAGYGEKMQALGYPYYSIGTRVSFDAAEAYPKFVFGAIRPLSDAEADKVLEMRDSPAVARILAEGSEYVNQPAALPASESVFEQPPAAAAAPPKQATPAATTAPAQVQQVASAPVPVVQAAPEATSTGSSFEEDLDAKLDALLG